ncbi:Kelch repeat-containing protein [Falsibacillus pallidus]|uniref:N-acetylneuraminic acid mutarotase n=1 Tax=Falsibacillus pallidus TaxID=493781 RepID=A0A370G5K0_9BACI|nr:kelch repeat-containing protein [Falsibacillus pallidus]RDI39098.1 N-acetylneuraminic acid mutarotase [Falsibacillus pallidus]
MALNPCQLIGPLSISCYLTDSTGQRLNPLDENSIRCEEVVQPSGRKETVVRIPNGTAAVLQKINLLKSGYIVVEVTGANGSCTTEPIPFNIDEEVLLCAPTGTTVDCKVTSFNCFSTIQCSGDTLRQLSVFLTICQSIKVTGDTTIEVQAGLCNPRNEILTQCPPVRIPMSCPVVFQSTETENTNQNDEIIKRELQVFEDTCIRAEKVYDWVTLQAKIKLSLTAGEVFFNCTPTRILVFGGENAGAAINEVDEYFCQTDSWTTVSPMLGVREAQAAGLLRNGKVIVSHGFSPSAFTGVATAEFYDPETDTWTAAPTANVPRGSLGGDVLNGLFYTVGGTNGSGAGVLATVEVFNPATNTWSLGTPLPTPRSELAVVTLNGLLHAIAGFNGSVNLADHDAFNPATNTWITLTPLPQPLSFVAAEAFGGKIYVFGGRDPDEPVAPDTFLNDPGDPAVAVDTVYIYDPATDTWSTGAPMPTARWGGSSVYMWIRNFRHGRIYPSE